MLKKLELRVRHLSDSEQHASTSKEALHGVFGIKDLFVRPCELKIVSNWVF